VLGPAYIKYSAMQEDNDAAPAVTQQLTPVTPTETKRDVA
jgi:hypothetical protein